MTTLLIIGILGGAATIALFAWARRIEQAVNYDMREDAP